MKTPADLTSETLIKRVMSGTKEYRTKDYLTAFSKIPSTQLHHSNYSRLEIIKLWNSLQNTPNKVRYFTFSLVDHNYSVQGKIKELFNNSCKWAYICHDQDKSAEHKHFHYVLMFDSPRSFSSIANDLEIPVTMLQKVYSKKGILDYLTHENDPNKYHYSLSDIVSNFDIEEEKNGGSDFDPWEEFQDFLALKNGEMSYKDWFDKYRQQLCIVRHFGSRLQMYDRLSVSSVSSSGASLSTRSEFRVPYPCKKKPIQTAFPACSPEQIPWIDHGSMPFVVGSEPVKPDTCKNYSKPNPRADLS